MWVDSVHLAHFMAQAEPKYQEELNQRIAAHHLSDCSQLSILLAQQANPKG